MSDVQNEILQNDCENSLHLQHRNDQESLIKPINRDTVHKICSGQVVLNLSIAVKELVENAIDAGGTNIEVKLKECGSELVEVIDNGSGVLEENFASLTLKHYTSKLKEFTDLESVETLGFRGEALSSLCALSNVTITTRHRNASIATKLEYDHNGKIIKQSVTSRPEGTTVTLSNIFSTLPVRRKEFMKNLKREFNKMCQLLYAYCLVCVNIKVTCSNQTKKGSKTTIVATQASSVRENIINVFGAKQISSLIDVPITEPSELILEEYGLKLLPKQKIPFSFECFISSVTHGSGRSASDRQFYYINSRPCEPTKVTKLVNEIYRQFNAHQYPFVYLNILIERNRIDVNVTPDKRQIFLDNEKLVLAVLKSSLLDAFKDFPSTYALQNLNITKNINKTNEETSKGVKRTIVKDKEILQESFFNCFKKKMKKSELEMEICHISSINDDNVVLKTNTCSGPLSKQIPDAASEVFAKDIVYPEIQNAGTTTFDNEHTNKTAKDLIFQETLVPSNIQRESKSTISNEIQNLNVNECESTRDTENDKNIDKSPRSPNGNLKNTEYLEDTKKGAKNIKSLMNLISSNKKDVQEKEKNNSFAKCNKTVVLNTSLEIIQDNIKRKSQVCDETLKNENSVKFRSQINPDSNAQAEQELQKQITKNKFQEMKIVGQFNLAFIIAQLENDLFIIDQHASDEKYNFEQLQMNTTLETQILVNPKELHLTAANESLLIDSEDIFKKNGFVFSIDLTAPPTNKVKLSAIPVSKNYSFGKDDIDELLFMLQDGNDVMCRPSRIRQMFASRACRKSVMVGKPLNESDMRKLVNHMGEIDQPWNCPHGRPTMRHLINMNLIQER